MKKRDDDDDDDALLAYYGENLPNNAFTRGELKLAGSVTC